MSIKAINAVGESGILPSGRKFVALALANFANAQWSCWPSIEQLANFTGQGKRTVQDHLDALEQTGFLTRKRQLRSNGTLGRYQYTLHPENLPVADFASGEKQPEPAAKSATHNPQDKPLPVVCTREPTPFDELIQVLDSKHAEAVIAHRKDFKAKFTPYAASLLAKEFAKCPDPNSAADVMIRNGWRGFNSAWLTAQHARGSPTPLSNKAPQLADVFEIIAGNFQDDQGSQYEDRAGALLPLSHLPPSERQR